MPKVTSKPAGKFGVKAGPSGKMNKGTSVGAQKPGVASVESSGGGGKFAKGGPSGKMNKGTTVTPQSPGRSGVR